MSSSHGAPAHTATELLQRRRLGASQLVLSTIGFGTWQIGGARFGYIEDRQAVSLLELAFDRGINVFDLSSVYGNGRSEVMVGFTFRDRRDQVIYVSKAGYPVGVDGCQNLRPGLPKSFSEADLIASCEGSLRRLRTDVIDVFLLHDAPSSVLADDAVWDVLRRLQQRGCIRHYGASGDCDTVAVAIRHGAQVVEIPLNPFQPGGVRSVLPIALAAGVGVLARSPFAGGLLLTNDALRQSVYPRGDPAQAPAQELLQFPLSHQAVTSVFVGFMREEEIIAATEA